MRPVYLFSDTRTHSVVAVESSNDGSEILLRSPECYRKFSIATNISWPRFVAKDRIVYYEHDREEVGVIDTDDERILWSSRTSGSGHEWFLGGDTKNLLVQNGTKLTAYSLDSGEVVDSSQGRRALQAAGDGWRAFEARGRLTFEVDGSLAGNHEIDQDIRDFYSDGSRAVVFEYFGLARLYNLRPFRFMGEIAPDEGTSFVSAYFDSDDTLYLSQTSKISTSDSVVLRYSFTDQSLIGSAPISCGGDMAFWNSGNEIAFRTLDSYSVFDGSLCTKIGDWG